MKTVDTYLKDIGVFELMQQKYVTDGTHIGSYHLKIIKIEKLPDDIGCYDIQVENTKTFIANGLTVSNCMIALGSVYNLNERLHKLSDPFKIYICEKCGLMTPVNPTKKQYLCKVCNCRQIGLANIPYATKLVMSELMCLHIAPRILLE